MGLGNFVNQIEQIDIEKGYGDYTTEKLADGMYEGYCEDFLYKDKDDGGLFIIKLKTTQDQQYNYYISINQNTAKFNLKNLVVSLSYIANKLDIDTVATQISATTDTENFVDTWRELVVGKHLNFKLTTNKNGYQTCIIEKPEVFPF